MPVLNGIISAGAMYWTITLLDNGHTLYGILVVCMFILAVVFQVQRLFKKT